VDRHWLLTSTFYGNWLPGDPRGFVSSVRDLREGEGESQSRREHDVPGTPYDNDFLGLYRSAQEQMRGEPIRLVLDQAVILLAQFQETARCRSWLLLAVAIMDNHVHIVVGVPGDPNPKRILGDFKAYGSRALTRKCGEPSSETWWTTKGSKRKLKDRAAVVAAGRYVRDQANPLVVWIDPEFARELGEPGT
jgi:REP element-mobilizing transposase RayT